MRTLDKDKMNQSISFEHDTVLCGDDDEAGSLSAQDGSDACEDEIGDWDHIVGALSRCSEGQLSSDTAEVKLPYKSAQSSSKDNDFKDTKVAKDAAHMLYTMLLIFRHSSTRQGQVIYGILAKHVEKLVDDLVSSKKVYLWRTKEVAHHVIEKADKAVYLTGCKQEPQAVYHGIKNIEAEKAKLFGHPNHKESVRLVKEAMKKLNAKVDQLG